MTPHITVALLSFLGTCVGTLGGILAANRLTNYRIAQLEKQIADLTEKLKNGVVAAAPAKKEKAEAKGKPDLNILFIYNMPFRAIGKMAGGMVSEKMVDDILMIVNGHFFRGVGRLIVDFFKNMSANSAFTKKLEG